MPIASLQRHGEDRPAGPLLTLSQPVVEFLKSLATGPRPRLPNEGESVIHVSHVVSRAARFYERLRYSVDYHEEHLLRRHALARILRRRFDTGPTGGTARSFLIELIHAEYLKNDTVPETTITVVQDIFDRYEAALTALRRQPLKHAAELQRWLIGVAAAELDGILVPSPEEAALVNLLRATLERDRPLEAWRLPDDERTTLEYVAAYRALFSLDLPKIRFLLLARSMPTWTSLPAAEIQDHIAELLRLYYLIEAALNHPVGERLYRILRRRSLVFHAIYDVVRDERSAAGDLLRDETGMEDAVRSICQRYYRAARRRLYRSAARSTIYIFLTKMVVALLIEAPIESYLYREVAVAPLVTNLIFPPALMLFLAASTRIPGEKNTAAVLKLVKHVAFGTPGRVVAELRPPGRKSAASGGVLSLTYGLAFILTYGAIAWLLTSFGFTAVGVAFFLFFLSIVSFFAVRVRQPVRDLFVSRSEHALTGLVDLFSLPVVTVGQWISLTSARFNLFLYLFDYFLEAPIKAFLLLSEDVLGFFREKREDII